MNNLMHPFAMFLSLLFHPPGTKERGQRDGCCRIGDVWIGAEARVPGPLQGLEPGKPFCGAEPALSSFVLETKWHFPGLPVAFPAQRWRAAARVRKLLALTSRATQMAAAHTHSQKKKEKWL